MFVLKTGFVITAGVLAFLAVPLAAQAQGIVEGEAGGKHTEPGYFRLMMACAEICRASAHFMLIGTPHHKHTCRECAEICEEGAKDCERLGDMQECVDACRACADSCRKMAA